MNRGILASRRRDAFGDAFIATCQIDDISEPLTLPVTKDYEIDWGDGVTTTTGNQHFYTSTGVKTVKMFGVVDDFRFANSGDRLKILTVENWGGFELINSSFFGCRALNSVPDDLKPVSFSSSFRDCRVLVNGCENFDFQNLSSAGQVSSGFRDARLFNTYLNWTNTQNIKEWNGLLLNAYSFNNDSLSDFDYSGATRVNSFMSGKTSSDFDYQYYDNLLIKWASGAANGGLDFNKLTVFTTDFGTIQYSSAGAAARQSLVDRGLIITDGGNNGL